jgi:NADH-ubiquinone oxidoreductase chain 2
MPKISVLILLLELFTQIKFNNLIPFGNFGLEIINNIDINLSLILKNLLLISSIFSLIIGTVVGLAQIKIKRLLAYSTISHIGFMLLALAISTEQSIDSFLFYLIQYILTNLNIFLILLAISYYTAAKAVDIKLIKDLQGLFFANPILSLTLSISLFSMAGIPPLMGFFSKQFVLYSALDQGYYFISILAIIVSIISASYYLKIIKVLHTANSTVQHGSGSGTVQSDSGITNNSNIGQFHSFIISSLSLFILLFLLKPTIILSSTQVLSLTLFKV